MPGKESEEIMNIRRMPFEEKIKLLNESDRNYVRGYIDRALYATTQEKAKEKRAKSKKGKDDTDAESR